MTLPVRRAISLRTANQWLVCARASEALSGPAAWSFQGWLSGGSVPLKGRPGVAAGPDAGGGPCGGGRRETGSPSSTVVDDSYDGTRLRVNYVDEIVAHVESVVGKFR